MRHAILPINVFYKMVQKYILFFLIIISLFACAKKSVELPEIPITGETEIQNHSQIWVFLDYDQQKINAKVNKNNIITTTHWIINMDKRIPMIEIVPVLEMIKAKRGKKSIHSVEGMKNYLSYSNIKDKNISLYNVDETHFLVLDTLAYKDLIFHFQSDYNIIIRNKNFSFNNKSFPFEFFNANLLDTLQNKPLHFFFDGNINYQTYLEKRMMLQAYLPKDLIIDKTEYLIIN